MNEDENVEEYLQKLAENYGSQLGNFPEPPDKDSMLKLLREIIKNKKASELVRVANFKDEEVASVKIMPDTLLNVATYADFEGYGLVSKYLRDLALNHAGFTLGRRAKLLDSSFTVRRETRQLGMPKETTKRGLFKEETTKEGVNT